MAFENLINITRHGLRSPPGTGLLRPGLFRILSVRSYTELSGQDGKTESFASLLRSEIKGWNFRKPHKRTIVCKEKLEEFLLEKGADRSTIASIIKRYPNAVTCRSRDLAEIWDIWQGILKSDSAVLQIVKRSPQSFFRSGGVKKLSENISFLQSLGLSPKTLNQLMVQSPRTFSNTVQLNKDLVSFLQELCLHLGGEDPESFAKKVITSNLFILTRSIKRLKANIECIQSLMKLEDKKLLLWFEDEGACILDVCNMYIKEHFLHIQQTMESLGFLEAEVIHYIYGNPNILRQSPKVFTCKVNLLLECNVEVRKIFDTPLYLNFSLDILRYRVKVLKQLGYDFRRNGPNILIMAQAKFASRLERLSNLTNSRAKS